MRKTIMTLVAALAVAFTLSSPASAGKNHPQKPTIIAGVVVGTLVGIGLYEGWFGASNTFTAKALGHTTAGAATGGFIAGVATVALIHAATTPCQGFHAIFGGRGCKNGKYVHARHHRHHHHHGLFHGLFWWAH
jgi:hypothetical protein